MAAVANNPQFARRAGVPQSVGREYMKADEGRSFKEGGDLVSNCGTRRKKAGGKIKGYNMGGSLKMVEKDGKQVPFYAADGVGKMAYGGKVKGMKEGGMCRGYGRARGNRPVMYS
jgi:hypothetical protein